MARLKYSELIFNGKLIFDAFVIYSLAHCWLKTTVLMNLRLFCKLKMLLWQRILLWQLLLLQLNSAMLNLQVLLLKICYAAQGSLSQNARLLLLKRLRMVLHWLAGMCLDIWIQTCRSFTMYARDWQERKTIGFVILEGNSAFTSLANTDLKARCTSATDFNNRNVGISENCNLCQCAFNLLN